MGLALLVLVGGIIFLAIFFKMAERDRQKHHDELYKQDPEANLARLKAQIADSLESTRRGDVQNVMEGLSRERGKGADWDTAIKAALPKAAGFQILQIRNNIV